MASLIVAGSTGAIGRTIVQHAAKNKSIAKIVALTRNTNTEVSNYAKLFGIYSSATAEQRSTASPAALQKDESLLSEQEIQKIVPVTFDWDFFLTNWQLFKQKYSSVVPESQENVGESAALCTIAAASTSVRKADPSSTAGNDSSAAGLGTATVGLPISEQLSRWSGIFSGHTYCAMALGTTRADAGSADNFITCDYDYVLAFTEAVLFFSSAGGLPFHDGSDADMSRASRCFFRYRVGDKANPVKPTADEKGGSKATFLDLFPQFKATVPRKVFLSADPAQGRREDGVVDVSSGTLKKFCQISAMNANKDSFILYSKVKGSADAAVAERILYSNELALSKQPPGKLIELSVLMPGVLERYDKTRGKEKLIKWFLSTIGVEKCGECVVSNFVFEDGHIKGGGDSRASASAGSAAANDDAYVVNASKGKRNPHAFEMGTYYDTALQKQQVECNGNKLLFYWQGNEAIEKQAARLVKEENA